MESIKEFLREYTDQVISLINPDGENESVHPGPGQQPQASSTKLLEPQAASIKPQAASVKLKPASIKLQDPGPLKKFQAPLIKALYQDK